MSVTSCFLLSFLSVSFSVSPFALDPNCAQSHHLLASVTGPLARISERSIVDKMIEMLCVVKRTSAQPTEWLITATGHVVTSVYLLCGCETVGATNKTKLLQRLSIQIPFSEFGPLVTCEGRSVRLTTLGAERGVTLQALHSVFAGSLAHVAAGTLGAAQFLCFLFLFLLLVHL